MALKNHIDGQPGRGKQRSRGIQRNFLTFKWVAEQRHAGSLKYISCTQVVESMIGCLTKRVILIQKHVLFLLGGLFSRVMPNKTYFCEMFFGYEVDISNGYYQRICKKLKICWILPVIKNIKTCDQKLTFQSVICVSVKG